MRFASAFISTLLSASIVLAPDYPYAGFRFPPQSRRGFNRYFKEISTTFYAPVINCDPGDIAYLGVAIGDPLVCGNGGIEAGVILTCQSGKIIYRPYWRVYPDIAHFGRSFEINQGDQIKVDIVVNPDSGVPTVTIDNQTKEKIFQPSSPRGLGIVALGCRNTAAWILRADVTVLNRLQSIPRFPLDHRVIVLYHSEAKSLTHTMGPGGAELVTMTSNRLNLAKGIKENGPTISIRILQLRY